MMQRLGRVDSERARPPIWLNHAVQNVEPTDLRSNRSARLPGGRMSPDEAGQRPGLGSPRGRKMVCPGTWLWHIPAGGDSLYRPPTPADGRWQSGANIEGIYLAAEEATAWAEWYRWLAELEIEPLRGLPRELWQHRVNLSSVADLTSADALAAVGLTSAEPTREQWPAFQDIGERLHADGCDGLLYRSAARADGLCLCVFRRAATETARRLNPIPPPRHITTPPTPPRGLRT